jgi:DNA-binding NarL/FixJ family response regulator
VQQQLSNPAAGKRRRPIALLVQVNECLAASITLRLKGLVHSSKILRSLPATVSPSSLLIAEKKFILNHQSSFLRLRPSVIALSEWLSIDDLQLLLNSGVSGVLHTQSPKDEWRWALKALARDELPISPGLAHQLRYLHPPKAAPPRIGKILSGREREVVSLLAQGLLYKQIASRLDVSLDAVRHHAKNIYRKLKVTSRTEATIRWLSGGEGVAISDGH